ncbi:MAG TPA: hypothetical protein PL048_10660 [Leptospiraceae bacterium]|nr:hypothetical protein [Leptospiraceae bacterium]
MKFLLISALILFGCQSPGRYELGLLDRKLEDSRSYKIKNIINPHTFNGSFGRDFWISLYRTSDRDSILKDPNLDASVSSLSRADRYRFLYILEFYSEEPGKSDLSEFPSFRFGTVYKKPDLISKYRYVMIPMNARLRRPGKPFNGYDVYPFLPLQNYSENTKYLRKSVRFEETVRLYFLLDREEKEVLVENESDGRIYFREE